MAPKGFSGGPALLIIPACLFSCPCDCKTAAARLIILQGRIQFRVYRAPLLGYRHDAMPVEADLGPSALYQYYTHITN